MMPKLSEGTKQHEICLFVLGGRHYLESSSMPSRCWTNA